MPEIRTLHACRAGAGNGAMERLEARAGATREQPATATPRFLSPPSQPRPYSVRLRIPRPRRPRMVAAVVFRGRGSSAIQQSRPRFSRSRCRRFARELLLFAGSRA